MGTADYAVVIGIDRYPLLKNDLEGPVKDATAFKDWLLHEGHVPLDQVKLVLSSGPPAPGDTPVQDDVNRAFREVFSVAKTKQVRRLYVYFGGHGAARHIRHVALMMANMSMDELDNCLNTDEYHRRLASRALFPEQVMFYDCCRNYDRRITGVGPPWTDDDPVNAADVNQFVLYAAGFTEYAHERSMIFSTRRGLFTRVLLEGLQGMAAVERDGKWIITTSSLYGYVSRQLETLAKKEGVRQRLAVNPAGSGEEMTLVEVSEPGFHDIQVTAPKSSLVKVFDAWGKMKKSAPIHNGIAHFHLPAAVYRFVGHPDGSERSLPVHPGTLTEVVLQ